MQIVEGVPRPPIPLSWKSCDAVSHTASPLDEIVVLILTVGPLSPLTLTIGYPLTKPLPHTHPLMSRSQSQLHLIYHIILT